MSGPTLPGDIPGLLRRCSPVLIPVSQRVRTIGLRGIVQGHDIDSDAVHVLTAEDDAPRWEAPADVVLDLSDATGCLHALWWVRASVESIDLCGVGPGGWDFMVQAVESGHTMHPDMLDKFRAIMLRAAGRTP